MLRPNSLLVIFLLVIFLLGAFLPAGALASPLAELIRTPSTGIFAFDRVDLRWVLDVAPVDSVTVDFGDGTWQTVGGETSVLRHFYSSPGSFQVSLTAWQDGQAFTEATADLIDVNQRRVPGPNLMFLHHSTGRYMMRDSGFRSLINLHNTLAGTEYQFWDHDYASGNGFTGIILPDSTVHSDWIYGYEANNIQPSGYHDIFCSAPAFRDSLFNRHDVIICKNDHSTGDIASDADLAEYQRQYLEIRDVLDQFPDKLFILLSGSSRRPENTTNAMADRARFFYDWLQSPEFMNGHPNIAFFDLFDALSSPHDPADPQRNMLRPGYRLPALWDDHPNLTANLEIGPAFADFLLRTLDPGFYLDTTGTPVVPGARAALASAVPNPFNPRTTISWELEEPAVVRLRVYDCAGRLVRNLVSPQAQAPGHHQIIWQGDNDAGLPQPSGVYFYRLDAGGLSATKRMTLLR